MVISWIWERGTGAIALALASELPQRKVFGIDYEEEVWLLASDNAARLGITNASFWNGSWFTLYQWVQSLLLWFQTRHIEENDPHLTLWRCAL